MRDIELASEAYEKYNLTRDITVTRDGEEVPDEEKTITYFDSRR